MSLIASTAAPAATSTRQKEGIAWPKLLWVAPFTVIASVAACLVLRAIVQALDPALARMAQLGPVMLTLAIEGSVAAVIVFVLFTLLVPRAIFWFRIVGVGALVLSWIPDIMLGLGGTPMRLAMRYVAPLTTLGTIGEQGGRPAGPPPGTQTGGPLPAFFSALPMQQVLVLMLLHAAVALVCIGVLTTLPRRSAVEPRR